MPETVRRVERVLTRTDQQLLAKLRTAADRQRKAEEDVRDLIATGLSAGIYQHELSDAAGVDRGYIYRLKLKAAG